MSVGPISGGPVSNKNPWETRMKENEEKLKNDGGSGKVDGLLNKEEVEKLYGKDFANNFDKFDTDKGNAKIDGLINASELGQLVESASSANAAQATRVDTKA